MELPASYDLEYGFGPCTVLLVDAAPRKNPNIFDRYLHDSMD